MAPQHKRTKSLRERLDDFSGRKIPTPVIFGTIIGLVIVAATAVGLLTSPTPSEAEEPQGNDIGFNIMVRAIEASQITYDRHEYKTSCDQYLEALYASREKASNKIAETVIELDKIVEQERIRAEEEARIKAEEEAARKAEEEAAAKAAAEAEAKEQQATAEATTADTSGWQSGMASAYSTVDNGGTATASGVPLDDSSLTCAVPASQSYLLGRQVQISYGGMTITATVTDTGGFESMGRVLDLSLGCVKAFGFSDIHSWGVRTVSYAFL